MKLLIRFCFSSETQQRVKFFAMKWADESFLHELLMIYASTNDNFFNGKHRV